jgi:hypothetical protein
MYEPSHSGLVDSRAIIPDDESGSLSTLRTRHGPPILRHVRVRQEPRYHVLSRTWLSSASGGRLMEETDDHPALALIDRRMRTARGINNVSTLCEAAGTSPR